MTELALEHAVYAKLTIVPNLVGSTLELQMSGICDSFAVKALGLYLDQVSRQIELLHLETVSVDVTGLSLLNSSSLKQFITFLRPIKLGEVRCEVVFVVDDDNPWQRRCLSALVRMCPGGVSICAAAGTPVAHNPSRQLAYVDPRRGGGS